MIKYLFVSLLSVYALAEKETPYYAQCLEFPTVRSVEVPEDEEETIQFDADLHFALKEPDQMTTL